MHLGTDDAKKLKWRKIGDGLSMLSVPLHLMDGAPRAMAEAANAAITEATPVADTTANNRPHFATQTDADRERRQQLYANADAKLSERWKNPSPLAADFAQPAEPQPTGDAKQDAYDRYDRNISDRWRGKAA